MGRFSNTLNKLSTAYMLGQAGWNISKKITSFTSQVQTSDYPYRPIEWADREGGYDQADQSDLITIVPNNISETQNIDGEDAVIGYFFDGFLRENHNSSVVITDHPIQDGANIADHAYNVADIVAIDIFVSDVMDEVIVGQFSEGETKSIAAYKILRKLKEQRQILTVTTRLYFYQNMLIENISVNDDFRTANALRCTVVFKKILMAIVASQYMKVSSDPQVNIDTNKGVQLPSSNSTMAQILTQNKAVSTARKKAEGISNTINNFTN